MEEMKKTATEEAVAEKEIKFENRYTRTEADYKEVYGYDLCSPIDIVIYVIEGTVLLLSIAFLMLNIFIGFLSEHWSFVAIAVIGAINIVNIQQIVTYLRTVKSCLRSDLEMNNGVLPEIDIKITEDRLLFDLVNLELYTIKEVVATKHYIYLVSSVGLKYILKKDAFTIGDAESFLPFMNARIDKPAPVGKEEAENKTEQ